MFITSDDFDINIIIDIINNIGPKFTASPGVFSNIDKPPSSLPTLIIDVQTELSIKGMATQLFLEVHVNACFLDII